MNIVGRLCVLGLSVWVPFAFSQELDHSGWTILLQKYVTPQSRVDYSRWKAHGRRLERMIICGKSPGLGR